MPTFWFDFQSHHDILSDTSVANMQTYTNYIVNFARSTSLVAAIYIFEAYDESWKPGEGVEKNWGLYYENVRTPKFNFDIASYGKNSCSDEKSKE